MNKSDVTNLLSLLKTAGPLAVVVTACLGALIWIQSEIRQQGSDMYFKQTEGVVLRENITRIDDNIKKLESKLDTLEKNNTSIIHMLGRLEAIVELSSKKK